MSEAIRQGDIPGVQLRRRVELPLNQSEAWRWIADPVLLGEWLASEVRPTTGEGGGSGFETALEIDGERTTERLLEVESRRPDRRVLTLERTDEEWEAETLLTFELRAGGEGGCELSVLQQGFEKLSLSVCLTVWEAYRRRWRRSFARLTAALG